MNSTRDPFDNEWTKVEQTPANRFKSLSFKEVIQNSTSWLLPDEWKVVARYENEETGQITEVAFRTEESAKKHIEQQQADGWDATYYNDSVMYGSFEPE